MWNVLINYCWHFDIIECSKKDESDESESSCVLKLRPLLIVNTWEHRENYSEYNHRMYDFVGSRDGQYLAFFKHEHLVICKLYPLKEGSGILSKSQTKGISSNTNSNTNTHHKETYKKNKSQMPPIQTPQFVTLSDPSYHMSRTLCYCFSPNSKYLLSLHKLGNNYRWQIYVIEKNKTIFFDFFNSCHYFENIYVPFFAQYFQVHHILPNQKYWSFSVFLSFFPDFLISLSVFDGDCVLLFSQWFCSLQIVNTLSLQAMRETFSFKKSKRMRIMYEWDRDSLPVGHGLREVLSLSSSLNTPIHILTWLHFSCLSFTFNKTDWC